LPLKSPLDISVNCLKCPALEEMEDGAYNHPVVVLKIRQKENSTTLGDLVCDVANTTSFGSTPLSKYNTKRQYLEPSLPISQPGNDDAETARLHNHTKQLHLENKKSMHKQSYVRLKHVYRVEVSTLRTFVKKRPSEKVCRAYKIRLDEESYGVLMQGLGLEKETWEDTRTLYETSPRRLRALANSTDTTREPATMAASTSQSQPQVDSESQLYDYIRAQQSQPRPHRVSSDAIHTHHTPLINSTRTTTSPYFETRHPLLSQQTRNPPPASTYYNPPSLSPLPQPARHYGTLSGYPAARRAEPYAYASVTSPPQRRYIPPSSAAAEDDGGSWWGRFLVGVCVIGGLVWWSGWVGKSGLGLGWF